MTFDDDETRAMENRLRLSGWTAPAPAATKEERDAQQRLGQLKRIAVRPHRPEKDKGFGSLDTKVRQIGQWLAANPEEAEHPLRTFVADRFGVSFDDAGRAVAEAERLLGGVL